MKSTITFIALSVGLTACGGGGLPVGGGLPCGTVSGAVNGTLTECTPPAAVYDSGSDRTSLDFAATGSSPMVSPVPITLTLEGRPKAGTFHAGDAANGVVRAWITIDTSSHNEFLAGYTSGNTWIESQRIGDLTFTLAAPVAVGTDQYLLHGSLDAMLVGGPSSQCEAHVDF
jgi:hypothetical protein